MRKKLKMLGLIFLGVLLFTSCDFFEYVPKEETNIVLREEKDKYIEQLKNTRTVNEYRDEEQRIFLLTLQEGINQLNECTEVNRLEKIFEDNVTLLLAIKTDKDYLEEEAELERLKKEKEELYIAKLNNLSLTTEYLEQEKAILDYYLELGINALKENQDVDAYEKIYEAYEKRISEIKTKNMYVLEWQAKFCQDVDEYVVFSEYREAQQAQIYALNLETKNSLLLVDDYDAMDRIIRDYKVKVYQIPTDAELYVKELNEAKQEAVLQIESYKSMSDYRKNEQEIIQSFLDSFSNIIKDYTDKILLAKLLQEYKNLLDTIKTDAQFYEEERLSLIDGYYEELMHLDISCMTEQQKQDYFLQCQEIKERMLAIPIKEDITAKYFIEKEQVYILLAQYGDPYSLDHIKKMQIERLELLLDQTEYRETQKAEIRRILSTKREDILSKDDYNEVLAEVALSEQLLHQIPTNDELWAQEDEAFLEYLKNKYVTILDEPRSICEADSYKELAQIIDFYAFYQIDGTSFERDTFRVKINFEPDKNAKWIKNEVYWHSELLRAAVGVDMEFEEKDRNLLIHFIPYSFASESNNDKITRITREECLTDFQETNPERVKRSADFNAFGYYKYEREISVWNTQQLWYALEHNYVPICKEGSVAQDVLNKAKEILREIITDDMELEEKIYQIFNWFGKNVYYDFKMGEYNHSSDMYAYPDENISSLKSFFAEGALLEQLAVCSGYAKAHLILLRVEGIESVRILDRCNQLKGKNSINGRDDGTGGYGSHEFVYIKIGDEWYLSDAEKSACESRQALQSYVYLLLPPSFDTYGFTVLYQDLKLGTDILPIYEKMNVGGQSIFIKELVELGMFFTKLEEVTPKFQTSLIVYIPNYLEFTKDINDVLPSKYDIYVLWVEPNIVEMILYT